MNKFILRSAVAHNQRYIEGYDIPEQLLQTSSTSEHPFPPEPVQLTDNQKHFIRLCASSLTYIQIANEMGISGHTANRHREDLFLKLNVKSRVEMVLYAKRYG
jgi:DNA-binding CsgD family transcriptional regulator